MVVKLLSIILPYGSTLPQDEKLNLEKLYGLEIVDQESQFIYDFTTKDSTGNNGYYQNAIFHSKGDWVCFAESKGQIKQIGTNLHEYRVHGGFAIVGIDKPSWLAKILGIRNISHSLPPVFQNAYIANNLDLLNYFSLRDYLFMLIKHADKTGFLDLSIEHNTMNSELFFERTKLTRPTFDILLRMAKNKLGIPLTDRETCIKIRPIIRKDVGFDNNVPVFINCRDRLDPLLQLVRWLESENLHNIILIDNNSSYKPLLDYYEKTPHKVYRLRDNMGQRAPWDSGLVSLLANNIAYIVTDPDIIPLRKSHGAVRKLISVMNSYPKFNKVGLALKIDNIPAHYALKQKVIKWESAFWDKEVEKDVFIADVDTTFAVYRPNTPYLIRPALRIGGKYTAIHEPWYQKSNNPTKDYAYYLKHARRDIASWGVDDTNSSNVYTS